MPEGQSEAYLPPIGDVRTGCLCCPPKPGLASLKWMPHPGFGMLQLSCDGETPDWWHEFCDISWPVYAMGEGWTTLTNVRGEIVDYFDAWEGLEWAVEAVTLAEIEECCAEDPDHDWRLRVEGPLGGAVYQRQGCAQWVAVERLDGFA